ncbi:hypothetical protein IHO40_00725 [Wolbachia endosymbiont of Mansonella ozzardi]|uniref:hypothetical protein n=1 Tax=Wolbachia endosymbiont of Mansonella ozzardi TaxID=137464 RepID=UPI001CE2121F|nr:hypothetical protein [Wolbachia endosymbiont of Mansonella ozzardi]MCA4774705.1 hypothetical protein [Wolbachia endosymbiont of Mansonella ozzardi]
MIEHINEVNNVSFGEMYKPLFPSREKRTGTRIDWESAFLQQEILLKNVKNNATLPEISHSPSKGNQLEEVGTMLDDIENDKHIRKKRQRS